MRVLYMLLFAFTAKHSYSQEKQETWHYGEVRLTSGDRFIGLLTYNLKYDIVECKVRQGLRAYSAIQVEAFSFTDTAYHAHRKFYSLPFNIQPDYKRLMFFESLVEGKLSLFAREEKVRVVPTVPESVFLPQDVQWKTVYDFYAADSLGNLYSLAEDPEQVLLHLMQDQMGTMMKYLKAKKPDFTERGDMLGIFMYYNTL